MSEVKKEIASAFKWILVIIVAAIAYKTVYTAERFRFINTKDHPFMRANTFTGEVEYLLDDTRWVSIDGFAEEIRLQEKNAAKNTQRNMSRK